VLFQQDKAGSKVTKGQKRAGKLIISGGNASEALGVEEKTFHKVLSLYNHQSPRNAVLLYSVSTNPTNKLNYNRFVFCS